MNKNIVKIKSIEINNIKNVKNGKIDLISKNNIVKNDMNFEFNCDDENINYKNKEVNIDCTNVIGLYGQNGSGKTALVDALNILKYIMMGKSIKSINSNNDLNEFITFGADIASIIVEFIIINHEVKYIVKYEVRFEQIKDFDNNEKFTVSYEDFKVKKFNGTVWKREVSYLKHELNMEAFIEPKSKGNKLLKLSKEKELNLRLAEKMTVEEKQCSFFFNETIYNMLSQIYSEDDIKILSILKDFANHKFFIINNKHNAVISMDFVLPIAFCENYGNTSTFGDLAISLYEPTLLSKSDYSILKILLTKINLVIDAIIPNLQLEIQEYGFQLDDNGNENIRCELLSSRSDRKIPIRCESDGIIKIISVLNLLINMYNDESFCVIIDELDAGIFEYLLGEILTIIEENAKGQLIFTSHNLRPLETLNKNNIYFTTTNENKRYIKLSGVKTNNNLRDFFIRSINLGYKSENIYEITKKSKIRRVFRKAGEINGCN